MKNFIVCICALIEMLGFIALVGVYGSIDQDKLTISDGSLVAGLIGLAMVAAGLVLWFTRDKEGSIYGD